MKKLFAVLLSTISLCALGACGSNSTRNMGREDLTMAQTILSIGMLNSASSNQKMLKKQASNQTIADMVFEHIGLVDDVLSYKPVNIVSEVSDKEEYEKKMSVSLNNFTGETMNYTLYYDFSLANQNYDEDETTYHIRGLAYFNNEEFVLNGVLEEEKSLFETEQELELVISKDYANYVTISQEFENSETEYSFEVVSNGVKVDEVELEIENVLDFVSVSFSKENAQENMEITFVKSENGFTDSILVEVELGRQKIKGTINVKNGVDGQYYELTFAGSDDVYKLPV